MLKRNLFLLVTIFLFSLATWVLSLFNYNPFASGIESFISFYTSLFFWLSSLSALLLFYLKTTRAKNELIYSLFWPSVRQGLMVGTSICGLLLLKGLNLLDVWVGVPVIMVIILMELFFQTKRAS